MNNVGKYPNVHTNTLLCTSDVPPHVRSTIYESKSRLHVCTKHSRYIDLLVNCWKRDHQQLQETRLCVTGVLN